MKRVHSERGVGTVEYSIIAATCTMCILALVFVTQSSGQVFYAAGYAMALGGGSDGISTQVEQ